MIRQDYLQLIPIYYQTSYQHELFRPMQLQTYLFKNQKLKEQSFHMQVHHELNSEEKGKKICQQFRNCFKLISYTVHHLSQGQSKTKASNINWCARHMVPKLIENGVNIDSTFITIMDSDSMIPEAYVDQYQKHIQENYENKHAYIYQPPQFFIFGQWKFILLFNNVSTILMLILFMLFEFFKRRDSKELYGIEEYKFHHLIEAPLLQIPTILHLVWSLDSLVSQLSQICYWSVCIDFGESVNLTFLPSYFF